MIGIFNFMPIIIIGADANQILRISLVTYLYHQAAFFIGAAGHVKAVSLCIFSLGGWPPKGGRFFILIFAFEVL